MPSYANGAETFLLGPASPTDNSLQVDDSSTFTSSVPFPVICENEIMSVTRVTPGYLWVTRASEAYAGVRLPFSHPQGATVTAVLTGGLLAGLVTGGGVAPTVTGNRGGNAALASLLSALASLGIIVDGTSP